MPYTGKVGARSRWVFGASFLDAWIRLGNAVTTGFGDTLDEARRELLLRGAAVHLTPKAYELLRLLLERRPAAVSKAEIHDRIWPGTFVSDVNLATLAFEIRTAIGDDPQAPRYIRTVRGFGYAFCEDVAAQPGVGRPEPRTAA